MLDKNGVLYVANATISIDQFTSCEHIRILLELSIILSILMSMTGEIIRKSRDPGAFYDIDCFLKQNDLLSEKCFIYREEGVVVIDDMYQTVSNYCKCATEINYKSYVNQGWNMPNMKFT